MLSGDFIELLDCTARFIDYGKLNVLDIFEWEQTRLFKQTGKQASLLKTYKKWNETENKIVSGKGVELDIDGSDDKIRFFDVSQTSEPKFDRKSKQEADSVSTAGETKEQAETRAGDITEIGITHKHRGLLLTALWMELSQFQQEYERNGGVNDLLCHVSVVYIVHSHFKSNWQDDSAIETAFNSEPIEKTHLLGAFYSRLFQSAINLIVKIERRFESLVSGSESGDAENYYMRARFYDICDKEKVAVCRLKPATKVDANLSIDSFEIIETLPYRPGMERGAFLEYLQGLFDNCLTLEHLVMVRCKNQNGVTTVTTYRVEVSNWNRKPVYVNFEIVTVDEAKSYYLRLISSETLNTGSSGGVETQAEPAQQDSQVLNTPPEKADNKENIPESSEAPGTRSVAVTAKKAVKRKRKKERTDILEKISRLKEDIQNKTC